MLSSARRAASHSFYRQRHYHEPSPILALPLPSLIRGSSPIRCCSQLRLLARTFTALFLLWNCFDIFGAHQSVCSSQAADALVPAIKQEELFISSTHWNNELILKSHWNAAIGALCKALGPENVYVSIYESGSWDDSKGALRILDSELEQIGVRRSIILDETTHLDEIGRPPAETGWIETPRRKTELRRIPYLARLRNLTLNPLESLAESGEKFDKILFLNDVVFTVGRLCFNLPCVLVNDTLTPRTGGRYHDSPHNQRGSFAAACSLDFSNPPDFYDTFALRDSEGHERLMQTWPYFRSRRSRNAVKHGVPVPVTSCWNGAGKQFWPL